MLASVPDTCMVLRNILRHIKDVPQQLQRLQAQSTRDARDFSALTDSLANLLLLRSAMASARLAAPRRPGKSFMCTEEASTWQLFFSRPGPSVQRVTTHNRVCAARHARLAV